MATKKHKVLTWVIFLVLLAPLLLLSYVALEVLFLTEYRHNHGLSYDGAVFKWRTAMDAGDPQGAIHWAETAVRYSSPGDGLHTSRKAAYRCLAAAHELAGEYQQALTLYTEYPGTALFQPLSSPLAQARVYYKMGRNEEAFRAYSEAAAAWRNARASDLPKEIILGGNFPYEKALSPFRRHDQQTGDFLSRVSYDNFLKFMREEWEKTGNTEEYREGMEFLESIR